MKTALVSLNVSYIHKNLALRWLMVTKPAHQEAQIFEGLCKAPLKILDELKMYQPDVVALSVYVFNIDATIQLIQALKTTCPEIRIVAGGPEATYHPEPLWQAGIDGIFRGEAELVFWDQCEGKAVLGYQANAQTEAPILKVDLKTLEAYPSPYFLPQDLEEMAKRYLYVETSRGCPYGCTYCMASLDRKVRLFSEAYMDTFFEALKHTDIRQVKFLDRTFNSHKDRALRLANQCLSMPETMSFHVELVGDTLDELLRDFFIHQGKQRFRMEIGVQSFNPATLKAVGRVTKLKQLISLIQAFSTHQLKQHTDLIAGLPYEDLQSFKRSYQTLIQLKPFEIQVGILKLLHGSQLRDLASEFGYLASPFAPYQITQSTWMTFNDIQAVEAVALATEKAYNSQKLKVELDDLFKDDHLIAFDVMRSIGQQIEALSHPYTNKSFYLAVFEGLKTHIDPHQAKTVVVHAYYKNSTLCPPALFTFSFDKTKLNELRETLTIDASTKHLILIDRIDGLAGYELWTFGKQTKTCLILNEKYQLERGIDDETLVGNPQ